MSSVLFMLDEIDEAMMWVEIGRREGYRSQGKCDYCGRKWDTEPSCKFPRRHSPTQAVRERVTVPLTRPRVL